jgi:glutathione S-transferase
MVMMFAAEEGLDLEYQVVDLFTGEQTKPQYKKLNPNGLVPMLEDGEFRLTESSSILKYLADSSGSAAYPIDLRQRARVNEMMDWFNSNFYRDYAYGLIYPQLFPHHKRPSDEVQAGTLAWGKEKAQRWLAVLDQDLIGPDKAFLCGDKITISDYLGAEMVTLGELVRCKFDSYPNISRWLGNMKALKSWDKVHETARGFGESLKDMPFETI